MLSTADMKEKAELVSGSLFLGDRPDTQKHSSKIPLGEGAKEAHVRGVLKHPGVC